MSGRRAWVQSSLLAVCLVMIVSAVPAAPPAGNGSIAKQSGEQLLARCEPAVVLLSPGSRMLDASASTAALTCIAFLDGFLYGHGWAAWRDGRDMYYCPPEGFSALDAAPLVVSYLREHPERLDTPAHVLVFAAFSHAYPCTPRSEQR